MCIRDSPACHQISGVVIGQGFPVSYQHFGKDVVLDFGVHLQVNESRGISGCLRNQNVCDREADHCGKGTYKFPGLVSGNNIYQIFGNQTGNQRDTCSDQTKQCIPVSYTHLDVYKRQIQCRKVHQRNSGQYYKAEL